MMADVIERRAQSGDSPDQRDSTSTRHADGRMEPAVGRVSGACFCYPDQAQPPCVNWLKLKKA